MSKGYKVAVVGATGAVGREMVSVLEEREFPVEELLLLASERTKGEKLRFHAEELVVGLLEESSFEGVDIALFSAGGEISRRFATSATKAGAVVVDNSSAFRMEPDVPLVVPEVNAEDIAGHEAKGIIANPNCSTIQMLVAIAPLHRAAGLTRVRAATYQSVSGAGQKGINELSTQIRRLFNSQEVDTEVFPHRIAFNVIPHIDDFRENGYSGEEMKMVEETKKILHLPDLPVSATCVRIPVFYGHAEAISVETARKLTADEAREILRNAEGVKLLDSPAERVYPMPLLAAGDDATLVGRVREDLAHPQGLELFVVADNVRKGAATNAVQIAERLVREHF